MSNNKQQTAIQKFWDKIALKLSVEQVEEFIPLLKESKEKEKRQHWATWGNGVANAENEKLFKDYWNETYGGNK